MQQKENVVSIWCGKFVTENELLDYVKIKYDNENDVTTSPFMQDFGIDVDTNYFDEDLTEASFSQNLPQTIRQHSYGDTFPKQVDNDIQTFKDYNSLYLIYDFDAHGAKSHSNKMKLMGVYAYKK